MSFKHLGLSKPILEVIKELGFEKPTDIQEEGIPYLLEGNLDFIGLAQTGTGKTAAFGWPILEMVDPDGEETQALILAPTRELGQQIAEQLAIFSKHMPQINVLAVYGGAPITHQIKALRSPQQVIIATPGRLIDLIKRKSVKLNALKYLVLDEADEMLNMGFKEELDKILSYTPKEKNVWLFSATMPPEIRRIVHKYMKDPIEVKVNASERVNADIDHQYVVVKSKNRVEALTRFLDLDKDMHSVIFCRTRRDTQALAETLLARGYKADAIHGELSQKQRDSVMQRFKKHELKVLIATDVAARGIDVNDLTHVFHFALPQDKAYYTHRSGRTARAGKKGISLAFIDPRDKYKINQLSKMLKIEFTKTMIPSVQDVAGKRIESWCMDVLNTPTKNGLPDDLVDYAHVLFGNLTKEELTAKLLNFELAQLNLNKQKDLNEEELPARKGGDKPKSRSGRGGYQGRKKGGGHRKGRGKGKGGFRRK